MTFFTEAESSMTSKIQSAFLPFALMIAPLGLSACLGIMDGTSPTQKSSASIRLVIVREATDDLGPVGKVSGLARTAIRGAGNTPETLESFQVAVSSIQLAKSIDLTGTAYKDPVDPFPIFTNAGLAQKDLSHPELPGNAVQDGDYIDFMSSQGLAKLATSAAFHSEQVGEYNYVLMGWAPTFKVLASVALAGGDILYTKNGTLDSNISQIHAAGSLFAGPAETVDIDSHNGGTYFHFLKPLAILPSDLNTTALVHDTVSRRDSSGHAVPFDTLVQAGQLSVMLIFNPDGLISAWDTANANPPAGAGLALAQITGPGGLGNLHVPALNATAIPYRQGQGILRETYLFAADHPLHPGIGIRTRVELYLVENNIVAINLRGLSGPGGGPPVDPMGAFSVANGTDGDLVVEDWNHTSLLPGFRRLGAVGDQ